MISTPYYYAMRRIPSLAAIRVFEAAARHENFTTAAEELGMTQAAVSYQIKTLEERLGLSLFIREKRRVTLTDMARRALPQISSAFDTLDAVFTSIKAEDDGLLTISTTSTFANAWLAWRLGRFQMAHEDLAVRLTTSPDLIDFTADDADVAIRLGKGGWSGLEQHFLFQIEYTPMCSPDFLAEQGGVVRVEDLLNLPLLTPDEPFWANWLQEAGIDVSTAPKRRGIRLDSQANEGHAAMAGQGVAMLTPLFWRNDMAEGRLIQMFDQVTTQDYGYWLVYPEHRRRVPKVTRFRQWLLAEIAKSSLGPA